MSHKLPILKLVKDELHLWLVFPDAIKEPELIETYNKLLTPAEQARKQRFHFYKHQQQYLITRALIRSVLSRYIALDPSLWRFSTNKYGRPEVITDVLPLRFNLSHTEGLIVCGVVLKHDIGVDVETIDRNNATQDIAKRFFSAQETTDLYSENSKQSFFDYWTLKESYIKARGMGLSIPLHKFSFQFAEDITICFNSDLNDNPAQWKFWLLKPTPNHKMAIAICNNITYRLSIKTTVPLISEQEFTCPIL